MLWTISLFSPAIAVAAYKVHEQVATVQRWRLYMGSTIQTSIAKAADLATDAAECQSGHSRINTKLCPTEVDNYSGHGLAFPAQNASAKTAIMDLQTSVSTITIFHTVLLLTNKLI